MKKLFSFLIIIAVFFCYSCEEVIPVDLNTAPPKLVIEAAINWQKESAGNIQKIKLSTTTGFYDTTIPKVLGATVEIKNSLNVIFKFIEKPNTGEYICSDFVPVLNESYTLTVINKGSTYTATETMKPVAPISEIIQNNEGGITGKMKYIKTFFMDPANETNYYLYKYSYSSPDKVEYYADEDTFFQGNNFFSISRNDDLKTGDKIVVSHFGISKAHYNYLNILINISGSAGGSPFQSPPATVRGNIINSTDFNNYPLGYFSLSESDTRNYTIE
jgi:hypothetical protein